MKPKLIIYKDEMSQTKIGYKHDIIYEKSENGIKMVLTPSPNGEYFTTICTFNHFNMGNWPEIFVNAVNNSK